jgi:mannitol/fructose-specific phosphotransferase system IIA component (Ntr-type)
LTINLTGRACFSGGKFYGGYAVGSPTEFIAEPDVVMLDLHADTGGDAVRVLHERLAATTDAVTDAPRFLSDLIARAQLAPMCIAEDVALPHARTSAVSRLVFAVGRSEQGVAFDAQHRRVRLVFLIGTPKGAVTEYLQAVAMLSRILRNPATRAGLYAANDEAEFRALLCGGVAAHR